MTPEQIPMAMVEAMAQAVHLRRGRQLGRWTPWDRLDDDNRARYRGDAAMDLAAALGVCEVEEQIGESFADEPTMFTFGSATLTGIMSRQSFGVPVKLQPSRRWVITTPTELLAEGTDD